MDQPPMHTDLHGWAGKTHRPIRVRSAGIRRWKSLRWLLLFIAAAVHGQELQKFVFEKPEMGIRFRISLFATDEAAAKAAADAGFARVAELNAIFSDYEDEAELAKLSRTAGSGRAVKVSEPLWLVLERSQQLAARTGGAFDVTCGPLTAMWRNARRKFQLPPPALAAEMRSRCGWQKLRLDPKARTAELLAPDMRLDLGGIAKGYACDEALKTIREKGFPVALVAGAGDMAAGDAPPGTKGWRIEVMPLDAEGGAEKPPAVIVEIANCGIATSGDTFQRLEIAGKRYSHVLDPRVGEPLTNHSLVTVIAPDCITADSLSKPLSILDPAEGMQLAAEFKAVARWQRQPGAKVEITETPGWEAHVRREK
jgi:FAD:protein FMN transferase